MRRILTAALLLSCALANACGGGQAGASNNARPAAQANSAPKETNANASNSSGEIGVASSHGGAAANAARGSAGGSAEKAPASTPELDDNVQKAEAKMKAGGASEADKKAAADAYFARADHFRGQGRPQLYKFALADYRRGLRLDPSNSGARKKMDEIVQIYESLGRPVPELGNEP